MQELAQNAVVSEADTGTLVYWPQPNEDGHYHQKTMSSTIRSTALALDAFAQLDPENILVPGIVRYLMGQRQASGWGCPIR